MREFFVDRPTTGVEEDEAIREMFKQRRPTPEELDSFVVSPERWNSALEIYRENRLAIIKGAALIRENAVSYRGFKVGCVAVGIEPNTSENEVAVYTGYNVKRQPGEVRGENKHCAERNVLSAARGQAKVIVALVTVSKEVHTDDPTKAIHGVLHPCKDCRDMFREYLTEGFMREDTILCNVNDSEREQLKIEERTPKELLDLYADAE